MKTIGTKVTEDFKDELEIAAQASGRTVSDIIRICVEDFVYGHYEVDGEHIVPTSEYLDVLRPSGGYEYDELGFSGVLRMMRKNDFPDNVIRKMNEQMMIQISDMGRYNPKRFRDEGC